MGGAVVEEKEDQWLTAKAQQLKERALRTADRTRRKQFLLIATEYQKLARQDGAAALAMVEGAAARRKERIAEADIVTQLRLTPQETAAAKRSLPEKPLDSAQPGFRRREVAEMAIWTILAVITLVLLLTPGDQTAQGLTAMVQLFSE